jgi:chromosome segregation ATPase
MASVKSQEQSQRLDRIEAKIDKLSETVIQMARVEEKLVSMEGDKKVLMEKLLRLEDRIESTDKKVDENAVTVRVINRVFWIVLTAVVGTAVGAWLLHK